MVVLGGGAVSHERGIPVPGGLMQSEKRCPVRKQDFSVRKQGFSVRKQGFSVEKQGFLLGSRAFLLGRRASLLGRRAFLHEPCLLCREALLPSRALQSQLKNHGPRNFRASWNALLELFRASSKPFSEPAPVSAYDGISKNLQG